MALYSTTPQTGQTPTTTRLEREFGRQLHLEDVEIRPRALDFAMTSNTGCIIELAPISPDRSDKESLSPSWFSPGMEQLMRREEKTRRRSRVARRIPLGTLSSPSSSPLRVLGKERMLSANHSSCDIDDESPNKKARCTGKSVDIKSPQQCNIQGEVCEGDVPSKSLQCTESQDTHSLDCHDTISDSNASIQRFVLPLDRGSGAVNRVSCETVHHLLGGGYASHVKEFVIVDCRFDYEHQGGHLPGAVSINRQHKLHELFASLQDRRRNVSGEIVIVFHCEYSQNRAPRCYNAFRRLDRQLNEHVYPRLSFPQIFVMEGGYRRFFQLYQQRCTPSNYVSMFHPQYTTICKIETKTYRQSWKQTRRSGKRYRALDR